MRSHRLVLLAIIVQIIARNVLMAQDSNSARRDSSDRVRRAAQQLERIEVRAKANRPNSYSTVRSRSATRTDTPLRDVPQSVTVVTAPLIADQAMQSMADVVRYVPGVSIAAGEGHRDAPTIRGNNSTADFFVDGLRDDAQYLRDVYNVERVEALKGSNAMVFGRGGGGGVINRVSKQAGWTPVGDFTFESGSYDHNRATVDVGQPMGSRAAFRVNAMSEQSGGFRDAANLRRRGIDPTVTLLAGASTMLRLDYEHFDDRRTVDRGIPSFHGAPSAAPFTTFFGDPQLNRSRATVDAVGGTLEHSLGEGALLRSQTRFVGYDKFYQNVLPGAVNAAGTDVALSAYNNAATRANLFNQTDLTIARSALGVGHTLLVGSELSRQGTDNFRNTGYFGSATTTLVPLGESVRSTNAAFRQSASDADNHVRADVAALYVLDQLVLSPRWQAIVGLRADRFALRFHDNRAGSELARTDVMVSPRAGIVYKPDEPISVYASYSVSHLPSSGDQFGALTATTETLDPERFTNVELGAKWDVARTLAVTAAAYRLDRTNTSAPDPNDVSRIVQTGAQRSTGVELGVTGELTPRWRVAGGFASQRAEVVRTTRAASAGATVPLVPRGTASLWNRVLVARGVGAGLGVIRQGRMYAAVDNTVTLPAFTRLDGALFLDLPRRTRAQVNVENVANRRYYATSQGNNNIMPGAPRTLRLSLTARL